MPYFTVAFEGPLRWPSEARLPKPPKMKPSSCKAKMLKLKTKMASREPLKGGGVAGWGNLVKSGGS